jgi:hypothetical protein
MARKMLKIIFLISLISIFFFPFLASSGVREGIQATLEEKGIQVLSVSEPDVMVPDQGITFELKDIRHLKPGKNRLEVSLFYNNGPYMSAHYEVEIAGESRTETVSWMNRKSPVTNLSPNWAVRKGDKVTLVFRKEGLVIKTDGKALENGRKNDEVSALNQFCNRTVKGLVIDRKNILIQD